MGASQSGWKKAAERRAREIRAVHAGRRNLRQQSDPPFRNLHDPSDPFAMLCGTRPRMPQIFGSRNIIYRDSECKKRRTVTRGKA
jgi:hypothetical protein